MELLLEFLFSFYVELMFLIVPEEKSASNKYRILAVFIGLIGLLVTVALFVWGCVLIVDYENELGVVPMLISIVFSIVQIVVGGVLYNKRIKK